MNLPHAMTEPVPCLLCQSSDTVHFLDARDHVSGRMFELRRCRKCGFVFTWPQPPDLNEYYPAYYRQYHPLILRLFQFLQQTRTGGWTRQLGKPGRALEVGCGEGWMLATLRRRGWRVAGLERTAASGRFAATHLGLPIVVGGLESLRPGARFDLIILHQVLEHLSQPMQTLQACSRLLTPGGRIIIEVPNLASWQFHFAGPHWVHLDVPRHLGHFTPDTIRFALEQAGLQVECFGFVSVEYDPFGWVQAVLNQMGFPQNLLLRWLAGAWRGDRARKEPAVWSPKGLAIGLVALVLAVPSFLLSVISWLARAGAIMEVRAIRPKT